MVIYLFLARPSDLCTPADITLPVCTTSSPLVLSLLSIIPFLFPLSPHAVCYCYYHLTSPNSPSLYGLFDFVILWSRASSNLLTHVCCPIVFFFPYVYRFLCECYVRSVWMWVLPWPVFFLHLTKVFFLLVLAPPPSLSYSYHPQSLILSPWFVRIYPSLHTSPRFGLPYPIYLPIYLRRTECQSIHSLDFFLFLSYSLNRSLCMNILVSLEAVYLICICVVPPLLAPSFRQFISSPFFLLLTS